MGNTGSNCYRNSEEKEIIQTGKVNKAIFKEHGGDCPLSIFLVCLRFMSILEEKRDDQRIP